MDKKYRHKKKKYIIKIIVLSLLSIILFCGLCYFLLWGPIIIHRYAPGINLGNVIRVKDHNGRKSASIRARYSILPLVNALYDDELYTLWVGSIRKEKYIKKYPVGTDNININWSKYYYGGNTLYITYSFFGKNEEDTFFVSERGKLLW